jgi:hypothetical protein
VTLKETTKRVEKFWPMIQSKRMPQSKQLKIKKEEETKVTPHLNQMNH